MRLATWAKRQGIAYCTAWRWVCQDRMPVPWSKTPSGTILVDSGVASERGVGAVALYARVSSNDQKHDLERQLGRLTEYATHNGMSVVKSVAEIGSGLNGHRPKLRRLLADPFVQTIVVEHRDRLARFGSEYLESALIASGRTWYASFSIEVFYEPDMRTDGGVVVGVDLGITALATLSDGSPKVPAPAPLRRYLQKLKRLSRALSRKRRGSRNRAKAKTKLARLHRRIADIRADVLHKLTTHLTRYRTIVIEDLNVAGMLANRHLSRAIADVGFFEFRRQLEYKTAMARSMLVVADPWFASSKLCSACEAKNDALTLSERFWTCASCGASHDRDLNAARNLARYAESSPASACGAEGADGEDHLAVKPAA